MRDSFGEVPKLVHDTDERLCRLISLVLRIPDLRGIDECIRRFVHTEKDGLNGTVDGTMTSTQLRPDPGDVELPFVPAFPFQNKRYDMDNKRNVNDKSDTNDKHGIVLVDAHDMDDKGNTNDKSDMADKSDNG